MSFHPDSVPSGDTSLNRVSVVVTDSSAVTYNRPEDMAVAEGRSGRRYLVRTTEAEQVALFLRAQVSAMANNASPRSHDASGPYSFVRKNCSSWAKDMCDALGLLPSDAFAYAEVNLGVGQEHGLDLTLLPQAVYVVTRGAVGAYDFTWQVAGQSASVAGALGRSAANGLAEAVPSVGIIRDADLDTGQVRLGIGFRF